jgi:hypothetical protein
VKTPVKVSSPNNLEWTVRRQLYADWMLPLGGSAAKPWVGEALGGPAALLGLLWALITLPALPLVLLLRSRGLSPWTLVAVARPWGRRGPPLVLCYEVRGKRDAADRAVADLVAKLARGDGAPAVAGAERVD